MSNFFLTVITLPTKINLSDGHLPSFLIIPKQNQNHLPKKHTIPIGEKNREKLSIFELGCNN